MKAIGSEGEQFAGKGEGKSVSAVFYDQTGQGTGLGLSLAYDIVKQWDGGVWKWRVWKRWGWSLF